ncbi:MAG: helix-turn-helix domain-containing protein [Oscillospiraceae bacterium]|jgi:transcriptional regulator with XRE-family HTH domain|nr:helix-turn-helix domain-containing protein [Oscillospiraceae bacterium]
MDIKIGENLKRLRRARDLTQEELAASIGVTPQAISKWENGLGYPDMTSMPTIAIFFDVTVDEIMGMDALRSDDAVSALLDTVNENSHFGRIAENIELLRQGVRDYPHNFEVWLRLASSLTFLYNTDDSDPEAKRKNTLEAVAIYERILERCTTSWLRNRSSSALAYAYDYLGEREKAVAIASALPFLWDSKLILPDFMEDGDEKRRTIQNQLLHTVDAVDMQFMRLIFLEWDEPELVIDLCERKLANLRNIFDDGEMLQLAVGMCDTYQWLAVAHAKLGERDAALFALEQCVPYAYEYDHQPETHVYTSPALRGSTFSRSNSGKDYTESWSARQAGYFMTIPVFEQLRDEPRFRAVVAQMQAQSAARDTK